MTVRTQPISNMLYDQPTANREKSPVHLEVFTVSFKRVTLLTKVESHEIIVIGGKMGFDGHFDMSDTKKRVAHGHITDVLFEGDVTNTQTHQCSASKVPIDAALYIIRRSNGNIDPEESLIIPVLPRPFHLSPSQFALRSNRQATP